MQAVQATKTLSDSVHVEPTRVTPEKATIVAVIPAYNEERFIASVVFKASQYATKVVVVSDGSSDSTAELAEAAGAEVLRQPRNLGKAEALNAGFELALRYDPGVVVCLDADAQHDAAEIPAVVAPVLNHEADVVIGSRFLATKSHIPGWRQVGQHSLTAVTNALSRTRVTDSQSGFRAFSPTAARALRFSSEGLSVESEMQFLFEPAGLRVTEVPISVQYLDGNKRNPVVHGLQVLDAMVTLVARRRPLLFLALPGIFLVLTGLFLGVQVTYTMQESGRLMTGSAILTALLIMGGMILGMSGVMLHSLGHFIDRLRGEIYDALRHKTVSVTQER